MEIYVIRRWKKEYFNACKEKDHRSYKPDIRLLKDFYAYRLSSVE